MAEDPDLADFYGTPKARFTVWDKLRMLQEWAPVLVYVQDLLSTNDVHEKSLIVANCCEWLASKTEGTTVDDELVSHITAVLKSPEGEALLRWVVAKIEEQNSDTE